MVWTPSRILSSLRMRQKAGKSLAHSALCRENQALASAAAYHFGSYRAAVLAADIDYDLVCRRPRWTKRSIITLIKRARRGGEDLYWSAVVKRRDDLGRAAFASLQPRLFGSWVRALHAAGLDADDVARYRRWDRTLVVFELRSRIQDREPVNSGSLQVEDPALHAAALRHFGDFSAALRAAHIDPARVRQRRHWTKTEILKHLRAALRVRRCRDSILRREQPALYGATLRHFKTFAAAVTVARHGKTSQSNALRHR